MSNPVAENQDAEAGTPADWTPDWVNEGEPDVEPLIETPANPFDVAEEGAGVLLSEEAIIIVRAAYQFAKDVQPAGDDGLSMSWPEEIFCPVERREEAYAVQSPGSSACGE